MRVFAVSDIHADYGENLDWIQSLSRDRYQDDVLIVAGDVSDDLNLLGEVFASLRARFSRVLFVPGNHELWVRRGSHDCSLDKFAAVNDLCREKDVTTGLLELGEVSFVPLLGWYDYSFASPGRELRVGWRDYTACRWPPHLDSCAAITDHFLAQNEALLEVRNETVISYSHFVPRIDVMPAGIPKRRRTVYPVLGSEKLGEQVRRLNSDIHVYGHSHVNRSVVIGGTRYVNNAFAYPSEERIARKQLHCIFDAGGSCDNAA